MKAIKELSILSKLALLFIVLSITNYYITMTIMQGSVFNPFYEWMNNQYLALRGTGTVGELMWKKITQLFSCPHCLGTHVGLWLIGVPFTIIFGGELGRAFSLELNGGKKALFMTCCIVVVGFSTAAGGLATWEVFKYPHHKLELMQQQNASMMEMKQRYLSEMLKRGICPDEFNMEERQWEDE